MDMTENWSSPSNSSFHLELFCNTPIISTLVFVFALIRHIIILPIALLVLSQVHQRWQQQRSFNAMSQSDQTTFHFTVMQLTGVPGLLIFVCGFSVPHLFLVGGCVLTLVVIGEVLFHVVTCVERYLAVVHPITYLELKNNKGVKIRRFCVGGVWFLSSGWIPLTVVYAPGLPVIPFFCFVSVCFAIVSFCSLSVLCALIRPGPGEVAGGKERVDESKQKAFHTVMVITGALWLLFAGYVVCISLIKPGLLNQNERCWLAASATWFSLPSSLLVQLLFLYRAGKLPCCSASGG